MSKSNFAKRSLAALLAAMCVSDAANVSAFSAVMTAFAGSDIEDITPVTDHEWSDPKAEWVSKDEAYANFTCKVCGEKRRIKADVEMIRSHVPTCFTRGDETYKATVEFNGKTYTDTNYIVIDNYGVHDYAEPEWSWTDGNTAAFAHFTCTRCGEEEETDGIVSTEVVTDGKDTYTVYTARAIANACVYTDTVRVKNEEPQETRTVSWKWTDSLTDALATVTYGSGRTETVQAEVAVDTTYADYRHIGWNSYVASAIVDGIEYFDVHVVTLPMNDVKHYEAKAPTCDEEGNIEYWMNFKDLFYYSDPDCTLWLYEVNIPALGHDLTDSRWHWYKDLKHAWFECRCSKCGGFKTPAFSTKREVRDGKVIYTVILPHPFAEGNDTIWDRKVLDPKTSIPDVTYEPGEKTVKLSWNEVDGAQQYGVCGYVNNEWKLLYKTTDTSYIISNLKIGTQYKVAVIPMLEGIWIKNFNNALTVSCLDASTPSSIPQFKVFDSKKVGIRWRAVPDAEAYAVAVKQADKWVIKKQLPADTTQWTTPVLAPGRYHLCVVAKVDGKWQTSDLCTKSFMATVK